MLLINTYFYSKNIDLRSVGDLCGKRVTELDH